MERRALAGVRVLDVTQIIAGPLCSRALADMGADVVRIDRPPARNGRAAPGPDAAGGTLHLGKRSVVLDLKHPDGLAAARELACWADVLVQNLRPGVMEGLGLGYAALAALNPRLIYVSISGFGAGGPASARPAFGATAHAEAGFLWVEQQAHGEDEPRAPGHQIADTLAGMNAFAGVLAALYDRDRTGRGQHVDVSLMDSQLSMLASMYNDYLNKPAGSAWQPFRHPIHRTRDGGHFTINIGTQGNWQRIAAAFGRPALPLPQPPAAANLQVGAWMAAVTADEAEQALAAAGVAYGRVLDVDAALAHPHTAARGMVTGVTGADGGTVRAMRSAIFLSELENQPLGPAPQPGAHTAEVLRGALGYDEGRIQALLADGAAMSR